MMRAWLLDRFEGLDALRLSDSVESPSPRAGEVLIGVKFASLNPADRFLAQAEYPARPPLPHVLGRDGCGVVEALGDGVTALSPGDRVAVLRGEAGVTRWGTFAACVVVPAEVVVPIPAGWTEEESAAAPLVYLTAHQALNQWGGLDGGTVLITGASGGVGIAAVQLAKGYGAKVIGLSRSREKAERLRSMGADLTLDPADAELRERVKAFTGNGGVDIIVDNIGGALFARVIETLGYRGAVSVIGVLGGPVPAFNTAKLIFKRLRIGGVHVGDYGSDKAPSVWREIVEILDRQRARPVVDRVFPMEQLKEAFAHLARGPFGKVLLRVR